MTERRLKGKVALITGAGSGVGRATAILFAKEGARVVAAGRTLAKCEETARLVESAGGQCHPIHCDVSNSEDVQIMIAGTLELFDALHVIVNNAGIGYSAEFADPPVSMQDVVNTPDKDWHTVLDTTLTSIFLTSKYGIPRIIESGGGAVVNISSVMGVRSSWDGHAYSAAKAGMNNLTGSLAVRYGPKGVRVNCVALGGVDTPMIRPRMETGVSPLSPPGSSPPPRGYGNALARIAQPEEIAYPILWLASDEASFVTGAVLGADGGATVW